MRQYIPFFEVGTLPVFRTTDVVDEGVFDGSWWLSIPVDADKEGYRAFKAESVEEANQQMQAFHKEVKDE